MLMLCYARYEKTMFMLDHVVSLTIHARGDTRGSRLVNDLAVRKPHDMVESDVP